MGKQKIVVRGVGKPKGRSLRAQWAKQAADAALKRAAAPPEAPGPSPAGIAPEALFAAAPPAMPDPVSPDPGPPPNHPADSFVFDLQGARFRYTDQMLLDQLRAFARSTRGQPFSREEFNAWPGRTCTAMCISRRFRTWRRALAAAGIQGAKAARYESRELIDHLERAWRVTGRRPGARTLRQLCGVTAQPYRMRWGTYMHACSLFVSYKRGQISLDQLLSHEPRPPRRRLTPGARWNILSRDGHRCGSCGRTAGQKGVRLEVDHILPVCRGGTDQPSNLRTLCLECNRGKAKKLLTTPPPSGRVRKAGGKRRSRAAPGQRPPSRPTPEGSMHRT